MEDQKLEEASRIAELISGYLQSRLSDGEEAELLAWVNGSAEHRAFFDQLLNEGNLNNLAAEMRAFDTAAALQRVKAQIPVKTRPLWPRFAAAAAVLVFLGTGLYFALHKAPVADIAAGGNKAVIALASGKRIVLSNAKNGRLADFIQKTADGKVAYTSNGNELLYDTIRTPRGGQYQLQLSDGTQVWLNAATSIRYPEQFAHNQRQIELLSGEAYIAVVHNPYAPFRVSVKGQTITDIGTHFDVNAYEDDGHLKATLMEGSIKVNQQPLVPGQQAILSGSAIRLLQVNTDEVVAWKNGMFNFNSSSLESIMQQLSRWYDVQVVYEDESLKTQRFSAISTRFGNVSQVLHSLELTGAVKFKIDKHTITVSKP